MISAVVDAAADLASYRINNGDWDGVERAVVAGLMAAPGAEQLHRIRFHALRQAGEPTKLEAAIRELYNYNEAHDLDVDVETSQLIDQLRTVRDLSSRQV